MEIDLIMGLVKPKIAFSALPTEDTPDISEADTPDFSALLSGEKPDDSIATDTPPLPELPPQILGVAPQEKATDTTAKLAPEAKASPDLAAKIAPDSKDITAQEIPNIPAASAPPEADQPSAPPPMQTRAAEIVVVNGMVALTQPERAAKATELAPVLPNTPAKHAQPEPAQIRDIMPKLPNPVALDSAPSAKSQILPSPIDNQAIAPSEENPSKPMPSVPISSAAIPPASMPPVPKPSAAIPPASMPSVPMPSAAISSEAIPSAPIRSAAIPDVPKISRPGQMLSKIVGQTPDQPAPVVGFDNIKTVVDDPAEIQFGIKIDRQVFEAVNITRATQPAAPVASQITAQLPQLLTKVDKQTIELRLDPPELGRVTIHITTNDQQVTAQVIADRPDTVDLMRRHAELLTATLARAGFSQADLSFQQGQGQHQKGEFMQFQSITAISESDEPVLATPTLTGLDGRLDIRL